MKLVPNLTNVFHTFRGSHIDGEILNDKDKLFDFFYKEMYVNGIVKESSFDTYNIPMDKKSTNDVLSRDVGVSLENRQRAKIISNDVQIQERKDLLLQKQLEYVNKRKVVYDNEDKVYRTNALCEEKICQTVNLRLNQSVPSEHVSNFLSYDQICSNITLIDFTKSQSRITNIELQAFIKVRTIAKLQRGKIIYAKLQSSKKPDLIKRAFELCRKQVYNRFFQDPPTIENSFPTAELGS